MSAKVTTQHLVPSNGAAPSAGALVAGGAVGILTTVESVCAQMERLQTVANVISPFMRPSHIAQGFAVSVAVVQLDPSVDSSGNGADVYRGSFMKEDQRAPNRVGLRKLSSNLGIEWLPFPYSRRVDDRGVPHYAEFTVEGLYRTFDSSVQKLRGSTAIDFRDGSEQIGGWTPEAWADLMAHNAAELRKGANKRELDWQIGGWSEKRVKQARQKVFERAETGAQNRAIRDIGLKHVYTLEELKKPFVCFRMTFVPDMNDPDIKRLVTQSNLAGLASLWPAIGMAVATGAVVAGQISAAMPEPEPEPEPDDDTPDAADVIEASVRDEPARPRARTIVTVGTYKGADAGRFVVLDGGELFRADDEIARAAEAALAAQRPIAIEAETRETNGRSDMWIAELVYADAPKDVTPTKGAPTKFVPPPDAEYVTDIANKPGETNGRAWRRYRITVTSGKVLTTFDEKLIDVATRAKRDHLPVRFATTENARYPGQLDLAGLRILDGTEPDLPFDMTPPDEKL